MISHFISVGVLSVKESSTVHDRFGGAESAEKGLRSEYRRRIDYA